MSKASCLRYVSGLLVVAATSALAGPIGSFRPAPGELRIAPFVELEDVTAHEMTQGNAGDRVDLGRWQRSRTLAGLPPLVTEVRRIVPSLWRMGLGDASRHGFPEVRYEVTAANGRIGYLSHLERPASEVRVVVEPLPPAVTQGDDGTTVLEGGMTMTLVLDDTRYSGEYAGTLTVVVHHL